MKTYEEMAQNALERIDTHKTEQMKRRKTMTKIAAPAVSFCLVAMLCVGTMQSGMFRAGSSLVDTTDSGKVSGQSQTDIPADDSRDAPKADSGEEENTDSKNLAGDTTVQQGADNCSEDACCLFWWHFKLRMSGPLYWAIEADPNGNFDILATYCPTTADITSFNYEGKTLEQWAIEAEDEQTQTARNGYKLAYNAYMESVIPKEVIRLSNSGIKCERADDISNGIVFTVTADELENLPLADLINWTFNLN